MCCSLLLFTTKFLTTKMEKLLRPTKFDEDPASSQATAAWRYWKRTFLNFLNSAEVPEQQKLNVLINFVGLRVYEIISEIESYTEAMALLEETYVKPKNTIFARHLLATLKQEPGDTLEQFLQKLQLLAKDCEFKAVTAEQYRDNSIREAFISGMASSTIRQRLLEKQTLDLKSAVELARSLEMAERQNQSFRPGYAAAAVPTLEEQQALQELTLGDSTSASATNNQKCYFCGQSRHPKSVCPARDATCKKCHKKGHFAKVCLSKRHGTAAAAGDTSSLMTIVASASASSLANVTVKVKINQIKTKALIDTGSTESFISEEVVKRRNLPVKPGTSKISMASGDLVKETKGYVIVDLEFKDNLYKSTKLSILPNLCSEIILGHDFLGLHKKLEIPLCGDKAPLSLCNVAAANIEPPSLFGELTKGWKPIATKSRRHNKADSDFIEAEVKKLLEAGIIEPSRSPWRAQVLVAHPPGHKRRMCVDYSQTVNKFTQLDAYPQKGVDDLVQKVSEYALFSTFDLTSAYHQVPIREEEKSFTAFEAAGKLYQFTRIPFGVTNGVACFQRIIDGIIERENLDATFSYVDNLTVCGTEETHHDANVQQFLEVAKKYNLTFNEDQSIIKANKIRLVGFEVKKGEIKPDPERLQPLKDLQPPTNKKAQERLVGMFAYYSKWIAKFSDKAYPLIHNETFPLPQSVLSCFENLKQELEKAVLVTYDSSQPLSLVVETDASDVAIAATLNQNDRPLAFFTRTLRDSEKLYPPVEREACAVIEALRKWKHYLIGTHFTLVTDNEPIAFMYGKHKKKIKNDKIQRWRLELSEFSFDSVYRPGPQNLAADALSRCSAAHSLEHLKQLHNALCHPGVTRFYHFVKSKNLPFSVEDVKNITKSCIHCAETKPRFVKAETECLIKATQPMERLSLDFKGPLPTASTSRNKYILTIIDEYSRFPFAFPCADITSNTVIKCLTQLFCMFGMSGRIHSDRGPSFMSKEVKSFLQKKGVATSRTTPYNPQGNGQVERLNGTLWKAITLALKSHDLPLSCWEQMLPQALHSIRSLLCTATNATPHERFFSFNRRSESGTTLPSWLTSPGPVLMKNNVRHSKFDPLVEEVTLLECNPNFALIRRSDGKESTVSLRQLAPPGDAATLGCERAVDDGQLQTEDRSDTGDQTLVLPEEDNELQNGSTAADEQPERRQSLVEAEVAPQLIVQDLSEQQGRTHPYNLRNRQA